MVADPLLINMQAVANNNDFCSSSDTVRLHLDSEVPGTLFRINNEGLNPAQVYSDIVY